MRAAVLHLLPLFFRRLTEDLERHCALHLFMVVCQDRLCQPMVYRPIKSLEIASYIPVGN